MAAESVRSRPVHVEVSLALFYSPSLLSIYRPLLSVKGVTIDLTSSQPSMGDGCTVELHDTQVYAELECVEGRHELVPLQLDLISGTVRISLPFSVIKTINVSLTVCDYISRPAQDALNSATPTNIWSQLHRGGVYQPRYAHDDDGT